MTRGKNAARVAAQARAERSAYEERALAAEAEVRRLTALNARRLSEIGRLRIAVSDARRDHTLVGTYTEADLEAIRVEARETHRAAVRAGMAFLNESGVRMIPNGKFAAMVEAFDCEFSDLLSPAAEGGRRARRATHRDARIMDAEVQRRAS